MVDDFSEVKGKGSEGGVRILIGCSGVRRVLLM